MRKKDYKQFTENLPRLLSLYSILLQILLQFYPFEYQLMLILINYQKLFIILVLLSL